MKKLIGILFAFACMVFTLASCGGKQEIAIVKYLSHTSLNEIEDAIKAKLEKSIDMEKYDLVSYDCAADSLIISQTMSSLETKNVAAVVAIATPVALAAANTLTDTPIFFAAVSDPEGSGVVGDNITGTSDKMAMDKLVGLAKEVNPAAKKLGFIYTTSETNSVANKNTLEGLQASMNFTLNAKSIQSGAEITEVFNSMKNDVDAFIVSDDNNVANAMVTFSDLCRKANIPMYCAADSEVKDGGMMGYSISYTKLGEFTADQVIEVLKNGKAVKDVPVKYFDASELALFYNSNFINNSSIAVSSAILDRGTDLASK